MECDWAVELGGDAAVIDAIWEGFVDLRLAPESAVALPETEQLPKLADVLVRLNAPDSPVWTAKCDVWIADQIDSDELDAPLASAAHALACYIDLLPAGAESWSTSDSAISWCMQRCDTLRLQQLSCCRADLVVRNAMLSPDKLDAGVTAYVTACGPTAVDAVHNLSSALSAFADSIRPIPALVPRDWKQG